jgi:hypothetical protein
MASKDDTALWLNNKLGSQSHLWSSSTIATQYTIDKLISIKDCFQNLDSLVKMKFFLSLFHISKRNLDEVCLFVPNRKTLARTPSKVTYMSYFAKFKTILKEIIDSTIETCSDQWVLSIAMFMQPFLETETLNTEFVYEIESFKEAFNDLKKSGKLLRQVGIWYE